MQKRVFGEIFKKFFKKFLGNFFVDKSSNIIFGEAASFLGAWSRDVA